jgi:hypothetical protein
MVSPSCFVPCSLVHFLLSPIVVAVRGAARRSAIPVASKPFYVLVEPLLSLFRASIAPPPSPLGLPAQPLAPHYSYCSPSSSLQCRSAVVVSSLELSLSLPFTARRRHLLSCVIVTCHAAPRLLRPHPPTHEQVQGRRRRFFSLVPIL